MSPDTTRILLFLAPLAIGGIIAIANSDDVSEISEKVESWIRKNQQKSSTGTGWFQKYFVNPVLWLLVKFSDETDDFTHRGMKNGVRIAATLYLFALWLYLLLALMAIALYILIFGVIIYVIFKVLLSSNENVRRGYDMAQSAFNQNKREDVTEYPGFRGKNIYSGTNWFNEELKGRVDEDGNIYKGTNWFNEDKIGRIDEEGNIFSGTNFFNEEKVGRVDEDGNLLKGSNWFNEERTGRVDDEGNIHKGTNWFNEDKTGRTGD